MSFTQQQKDLLIGSLLGDGNLQSETKGQTWRYRALHSNKHRDYLNHKYSILQYYCHTPPIFESVVDQRTGKRNERWYFNTLTHPSLRYYGNLFYTYNDKTQKMEKHVPHNIQELLTPRAVAYWYMDDGALKWKGRSNAMRICTECFSEQDVERLRKALKNKYQIHTNRSKRTKQELLIGYRLEINEENSLPFSQLIRPYLINCMMYKVSPTHL